MKEASIEDRYEQAFRVLLAAGRQDQSSRVGDANLPVSSMIYPSPERISLAFGSLDAVQRNSLVEIANLIQVVANRFKDNETIARDMREALNK